MVEGKRKRPLRVTIIGVLSILAGLIYLFPVLGGHGVANIIVLTGDTFYGGPLALTAFVIAMVNFTIGMGCLLGWRPIWIYLVIVSVINFVLALIIIFNLNMGDREAVLIGIFWLAVATYVLLTVRSSKTKAWFHI